MLDSYSPDQLSAFLAGVTGVTAVTTGLVAVLTLRSLQNDSREPVATGRLRGTAASRSVKHNDELVVQNVGQTP